MISIALVCFLEFYLCVYSSCEITKLIEYDLKETKHGLNAIIYLNVEQLILSSQTI